MPASRGLGKSRLWADDLELAKKDDDLHAPRHSRKGSHSHWQAARMPRRRIIARFAAYVFIALLIVVGCIQLVGSGDSAVDRSYANRYKSDDGPKYEPLRSARRPPVPDTRPDGRKGALVELVRTYSGPIKLPELGESLRGIAKTGGKQAINRNVLFAAASLQSAATLLPLACKMADGRHNYVHFAFMGRSDISLAELLKINGIEASCPLIGHDARPDHSVTSTEVRMMMSTARALYHINSYMHPQAILIDSTDAEEEYFLSGARDQIRGTNSALIELPDHPETRLSWLTKLDSASLGDWNKVHIDIVIQAPLNGAGNLKRLLNSLSRADLSIISPPHLTIELPNIIEPQLESLLAGFQWPPNLELSVPRLEMLSLRHRITRPSVTEEESSVRFLESFWPRQLEYSHVLVLSPHTEVTPQFFHYLKYTLLYHRYSREALMQDWDTKMLGISFATPTTLLDSSQALAVPKSDHDNGMNTAFLWQAPNSDATLFLGDKWVELHGYVSRVLEKQHSASASHELLAHKEISKKYPSWLEYALQLSRLRGYYTIYPGKETASTIMGVHNDLPEVPEEYQGDKDAEKDAMGDNIEDQATSLFDPESKIDMMATLSQEGILPLIGDMKLLSWDGKETLLEELDYAAKDLSAQFRREVGQCSDDETERLPDKHARDLFCKTKEIA